MAKRGFPVSVIKHPDSLLERIQRFTWHTVKKPGNGTELAELWTIRKNYRLLDTRNQDVSDLKTAVCEEYNG